MKRVLKSALVFLPFVALILFVNWYADPGNVLRGGYEQSVAAILASGQNAANLRNMDDRAFMKAYVPMRTQPIDTLVLGSSHCMQITKELTGDENTFCAGVTGADLRDCISIYRLVRENGFAPKRVILTVDCWFLSAGTLEKRAMTDGYNEFCRENGFEPLRSSKMDLYLQALEKKGQAISIPYFQTSLDYLKKGLQKNRDAVPTMEPYAEGAMRRADGSYCYEASYRNATEDEARARAADCVVAKPEFAVNFNGVSDDLVAQMSAFIDAMKADGAQVALMLAPFHPLYYDHMVSQTDNYVEILATQSLITEIAQEHDVPLFGSYSPYDCGLTAADFYDGLHCSQEAMYRFYPQGLFDTL